MNYPNDAPVLFPQTTCTNIKLPATTPFFSLSSIRGQHVQYFFSYGLRVLKGLNNTGATMRSRAIVAGLQTMCSIQ
jgi:hypothetical protein